MYSREDYQHNVNDTPIVCVPRASRKNYRKNKKKECTEQHVEEEKARKDGTMMASFTEMYRERIVAKSWLLRH